MSRKIIWTKEKYALALQGNGLPGLRRVVDGFTAKDGYDIRLYDTWTAAQKRRIQKYYGYVRALEAQERHIIFPRSEKIKKTLTDAFHGDIPSKHFKAVFMPYNAPKTLPGAKPVKPHIKINRIGQIIVKVGRNTRTFTPFDQVHLALYPEEEIDDVYEATPKAKLFFVQVGEYQTVNAKSRGTMKRQILHWMNQYDGVKPLPVGSGNTGDAPELHHYSKWLSGMIAYEFPEDTDMHGLAIQIAQGRLDAKGRAKERDKKMYSMKGIKKAKSAVRAGKRKKL